MLAKLLKSFKLGLHSMWTKNFQIYKLDLEKAEEPEIKLPTSAGSLKKKESSRKISTFALLTMPNPLTVWITGNCGKLKRWEYQATWPASWEICIQFRKQQLELDMEQQTGSKLGREYTKALYCHPTYITYKWTERKENKNEVAQSCPTLCNPIDRSTTGFPVHHQLPKFTQTPVHWISDAIQPSHPLSSPSPPAFNLSQHQGMSQFFSSGAKALEFQLHY